MSLRLQNLKKILPSIIFYHQIFTFSTTILSSILYLNIVLFQREKKEKENKAEKSKDQNDSEPEAVYHNLSNYFPEIGHLQPTQGIHFNQETMTIKLFVS